MKKFLSMILVICILSGGMPVFAASPYEIVSEFSDEDLTGVIVKANEDFEDFTLYAAYTDGEYVYDVKSMQSSKLKSGREISFDTVEGAEIKFFAWDDNMAPAGENFSFLDYGTVMNQLKTVNDYWIRKKANVCTDSNPWEVAVFHTGNMQAYYMTGDELYRNYAIKWSDAHSWQSYGYPVWDTTNADNICCFRTYIDLYNIDSENSNIDYVKRQVDEIVNSSRINYWNWIDAFYMAGPIFTKMYELTGERKYLDKMYEMIKYTAETLGCYDKEAGLWFRDASFIDDVSENGEKVYWSRGDGWVYAAFAQIIEELPDSYEHKDYFVDIFIQMSAALKKAQCEDGAWHESLLDKYYNPDCEESGTGFFVYGMLWGINNGYLSESEYFAPAARGWKWLSEVALQDDGHIGYVQHIGAQPTKNKLTKETTQHYAYANFVFAASEMAKYLGGMQGDVVPYLQKKLLGNIEIYKDGAEYAIINGEIVQCDVNCEDLNIPEGMYLYKYDDLYIISEFITPFNKTETNLLDLLSDILTDGTFPERAYSNPDRIPIVGKIEIEKPEGGRIWITVDDITVSQIPEEINGPGNMIDKNIATRWAARVTDKSEPCWAVFDLGKIYELGDIGISFNNGTTRSTEFSVEVSADGESYSEVIEKRGSSGATNDVEYYSLGGAEARFVKLYGYGNSSTDQIGRLWFSPTEVEFYKVDGEDEPEQEPAEPDEKPEGVKADLSEAVISASIVSEQENGPENICDGDFESYCTLYVRDEEAPEYIEIDLVEEKSVSQVGLAFRWATMRTVYFDIRTSLDGENYETVVPKRGSGNTTDGLQYFDINKNARYIRVYGYSNTYNTYWVSITEAEVYLTNNI